MQLSRKSFVAHVAYYNSEKGVVEVPSQTSVCQLFWRFLIRLVIIWPLTLFCMAVLMCILLTAGFMVAHRPPLFAGDPQDRFWVPYRWWPTALKHRIYPGVVLAGGILVMWLQTITLYQVAVLSMILGMICGVLMLCLMISRASKTWKTSSTRQLIEERYHAFKSKSCPIVYFTE